MARFPSSFPDRQQSGEACHTKWVIHGQGQHTEMSASNVKLLFPVLLVPVDLLETEFTDLPAVLCVVALV